MILLSPPQRGETILRSSLLTTQSQITRHRAPAPGREAAPKAPDGKGPFILSLV